MSSLLELARISKNAPDDYAAPRRPIPGANAAIGVGAATGVYGGRLLMRSKNMVELDARNAQKAKFQANRANERAHMGKTARAEAARANRNAELASFISNNSAARKKVTRAAGTKLGLVGAGLVGAGVGIKRLNSDA